MVHKRASRFAGATALMSRILRPGRISKNIPLTEVLPGTDRGTKFRLTREGRCDAAVSFKVQLHAGDLGEVDEQPRGSPEGSPVLHRVGWRETPRVLVRLWQSRWLQPVGSSGQRIHGRSRASNCWWRCPQLV